MKAARQRHHQLDQRRIGQGTEHEQIEGGGAEEQRRRGDAEEHEGDERRLAAQAGPLQASRSSSVSSIFRRLS